MVYYALQAHITQQQVCSAQSHTSKNVPPPPPPRWAKPPFSNPPNEIQCLSPLGMLSNKSGGANITVTTTVTFSVNNQQNQQQLTDEDSVSQCGRNNNSIKSNNCINKIHSNSFDEVHTMSSNNACQVMILFYLFIIILTPLTQTSSSHQRQIDCVNRY